MLTVGTLISGPVAKFVYRDCNPYYLNYIAPKILPFWTKNFTRPKKIITSVLIDSFIIAWPYMCLMIFVTNMFGTKGNV